MAALALAVVAVSTSAILIRLSSAPKGPMAFWRVAFTWLLLVPLARGSLSEFRALRGRDLLSALLAGVALAAHFAAWFESVDRTTVAASVTLVTTQPAFVAVGAALLLDEPLSRRTALGIGVALAGSGLMSLDGLLGPAVAPAPLMGNALALAGAVFAAAYVLAGRSVRQRVALVPYVLVVYVVCAAGLLGYSLAQEAPLVAYPAREWLLFLGMAIGPGVFGHTVINWALAHVESSVVSVSLVGEPVGSTLLALVILGEVPGAVTLAGGAVVLAGIYVTARARS
ncbi:DMT family transporter [Halosegnis sp.]|uniref:DMT family transporter n=1 Tax=Halosegnis sp. TaxID=2864959 RepID=UPI0035D41223